MDDLATRATRVFERHPAPALRIDELQRLVRGTGVAVGEDALLRALTVGGDRFRVVDPWRGPWVAGRGHRRAGRPRWAAVRRGRAPAAPPSPLPGLGQRWIVAHPAQTRDVGDRGSLRRLRRALGRLGWRLDDASPRDAARWCRLVVEGTRVLDRVRAVAAR